MLNGLCTYYIFYNIILFDYNLLCEKYIINTLNTSIDRDLLLGIPLYLSTWKTPEHPEQKSIDRTNIYRDINI